MNLHGFGDQLLAGTLLTLQLAFASLGVGLALGMAGALAKTSRNAAARWAGSTYTTVVRGVPELLVVLLVYFGASQVLTMLAELVGLDASIEVDAFTAGTVALGLTFGAYATEVLRGALQTVPHGHVEAAQALGMGSGRIFIRIVMPQAWRVALPGLGNLFLVLLKDTALISVIGLEELMRKSAIAVSHTKEPFTFYMAAALIYLGLTVAAMTGLALLEKRAARGFARRAA
ncbi:MAG: ABC transporter permease subunit [Alphaproteobacteria bacterium]|nr:ABC transporter permease subunit [Alphaproteobacteria bacterium]